MVAMGTSLSDRAWDRESAVYRVSGVFAVIGGWFFTALIAFTVSGVIALIIALGGNFMFFVFIAVALVMVVRTHVIFTKRSNDNKLEDEDVFSEKDAVEKVLEKCYKLAVNSIVSANKIFSVAIDGFLHEDRAHLKEGLELKNELNKKSKKQKNKVFSTLSKIEGNVDSGHFYVQFIDYQREMAHSLNFIVEPLYEHLDNQHKPFRKVQAEEMTDLINRVDELFNFSLYIIKENNFE